MGFIDIDDVRIRRQGSQKVLTKGRLDFQGGGKAFDEPGERCSCCFMTLSKKTWTSVMGTFSRYNCAVLPMGRTYAYDKHV